MVIGGRVIVPYLQKHCQKLAGNVLELGPFFNPLMASADIKTNH